MARRILRLLLRGLLALAILSAVAWYFRQQLIAPLLRPHLERAIATALGAQRVSIGALDGNWFCELDAKDLVVEEAPPPLCEVRGARVEARYSLWALLGGDLASLLAVRVSAVEVVLDLSASAPSADPATATANAAASPFANGALTALRRVLPEGASARVERLRVVAPQGERQGPLAIELRKGIGQRSLFCSYSGLRVEARIAAPGSAADPLPLRLSCDAEDPGALLDLFGLGAGVRGGTLHAEVDIRPEPLLLEARLDLGDLVHGDQRLARSHVVARLDRQRLAIDRASLDLPGVAVELHELAMPSPLATDEVALGELAGRFFVRIDDLSPHASLLPAPLQNLLPIQGRLTGLATGGMLRFDASELRTRGAHVQIESGLIPFVSDNWPAAEGEVRCAVTFTGFATDLPWLGATTVSGRVGGSMAGSLADPKFEATLDLGECRTERGRLAGAQGLLRLDSTAISIQGLRVLGLGAAAFGSDARTNVDLDASCRRRAGGIDLDSLVIGLEIGSFVPSDLLASAFFEHGLGQGPEGLATLQLRARHAADGIAIESLRLRSAPQSPVEIAIDGAGVLPLHWSGTAAPTPLAAGAIVLHASARRAATAAQQAIALAGTLRLDAGSAALSQLDLALGPARVRGEIAAAQGIASLFDPASDLAATPLHVAIDLEQLELATLPAAWVGPAHLRGLVTGRAHATGPVHELAPDLLLTLTDGEVSGAGLPSLTDARLRLAVTTGDPAAKTILVTTSASAQLDPQLGLDREVAFAAKVRCDESGTQLAPSVLRFGGGDLAVELASNLRRSDLLRGAVDGGRTTLAGKVSLREFALGRLPPRLLGVDSLHGMVTGEVVLDGVPGAAPWLAMLRTGHVSVRDGELKVGDMPRLEHVAAELRGDRHELVLSALTGTLGAGRFSAHGLLRQSGSLLDAAFADAALELRLDGEDLLLYRGEGAKVRASVRATASGTLRAVALRGDVQLGRGSKYVRRISVLPALGTTGGAAANEGFHLGGLPPALGDRIDLDLSLTTRDPLEVRTQMVDGDIDVIAHVRGKGSAPRLEGAMSMRSGVLRFPGANLDIESALLSFTPREPLFPELLVSATGRRMGIAVSMSVTGRYDRPHVQLSSVPTLPPQDLIVLLTTGQLPSMIAEGGAAGQARFLGGYLAKEVFEKYFGSESTERGASPFDRLTIETGREVSQNGTESVLVEYELLPRFSVQVERDAYEDYNLGLVLRFRFR